MALVRGVGFRSTDLRNPPLSILASELVGVVPLVLMESALDFAFDRQG